jgi:hypothetical protein
MTNSSVWRAEINHNRFEWPGHARLSVDHLMHGIVLVSERDRSAVAYPHNDKTFPQDTESKLNVGGWDDDGFVFIYASRLRFKQLQSPGL